MDIPDKGCGPQLFANATPTTEWDVDQLGEFAAVEHQAILSGETTLAPRYWRLGLALNLARKQIRHGKWMNFLRAHVIDKTRASKARAIHRTFERENDLDGLTVEEAYARRARRRGGHTSESRDPIQKLATYLHALRDVAEDVATDAPWTSPESAAEVLNDLEQVVSALDQIRQILLTCVAATK
jgi:hypothetical protein